MKVIKKASLKDMQYTLIYVIALFFGLILFGLYYFNIIPNKTENVNVNIEVVGTTQYKGHDIVVFGSSETGGFSTMHSPECRKCFEVFD